MPHDNPIFDEPGGDPFVTLLFPPGVVGLVVAGLVVVLFLIAVKRHSARRAQEWADMDEVQ